MDRLPDFLGPLLLPHLPLVLDYILTTLLTALAAFALRRFQLQISNEHIQKAHQALLTAALAGVRKGLAGANLESFIVNQARASSPTAMGKLEAKASSAVFQNIVVAKVQLADRDLLSDALTKATSIAAGLTPNV